MEQQVIFRDYQEAQTADFNNLQSYTRQSFDDLVNDAVTESLRYSGFHTVQSNTAEITAAAGRFYGANANGEVGAIFTLPHSTIISLVQYLAVSTQRILTLVVSGVETQENIQTRDFLTNTTTLQTEPQAVAMMDSRDAVLSIIAGAEAASPSAPAIGVAQVAIANILISTTGVVSISMLSTALVTSTEDLDARLLVVETFDQQVENQVSTLASDLAALANKIGNAGSVLPLVIELMQDVARVKTLMGLPDAYAQYGASYFLYADSTQFDTTNSEALGYNCNINMGIRFPWENAADFALTMFNPLDPNGMLNSGSGLLLPAYTNVIKMQTGSLPSNAGPQVTPATITGNVALGQYGYQTFTQQEIDIPYMKIQNGGAYYVCSNGVSAWSTKDTAVHPYWLPNFSTYTITEAISNYNSSHEIMTYQYLQVDNWTEPYWTLEAVPATINGALIAQTMLVGSDTWLTRIGIWFATVASPTNVIISIVECTDGQPDMTKVMVKGTLAGAALTTGMNFLQINPTFVEQGMRIAIVITTMANHQVGLVKTGSYTSGTFFYSLDGSYFLGDFTKDLAVQLWGCQFNTSQTTIQLGSLNLAGGIRDITIVARLQVPKATQLIFEVQPVGTSAWLPISAVDPLAPFNDAPVLCNFQVRFIGSPSIMPGLVLPDSLCLISCPGPAFTFISLPETLAAPTATITIRLQVEAFNPITPAHTCGVKIHSGTSFGTLHNPTATTTTLLEAAPNAIDSFAGTYEILATFSGLSPTLSTFVIEIDGTTNSVADTFLVADMVWYAL
jgi:hypothetical protein